MTPRILALLMLPIAATLAAVAACGGDDGGNGGNGGGTGQITDPRTVPTATLWPAAPSPIILDPDNLTPISGGNGVGQPDGDGNGDGGDGDGDGNGGGGDGDGGDGGDNGDAGPPPGECGGPTYTIQEGDNFFLIAERCGLDPDDIIAANPDVDPSALSIGQVINLPSGGGGDGEE